MLGVARRLASNLVRIPRRVAARSLLREGGSWLVVRVGRDTDELRPPSLPWGPPPTLALLEVLRTLEAAAADPRIDGVVLRFESELAGWSKAVALRRELAALRARGKRVVAWAESLSTQQYWVATSADRIWLPESGQLFLVGIQAEQIYLRGLLSHLDVKPEILRIGNFKTAGEALTREGMSSQQREQIEGWQDDLFEAIVGGIAEGRELEPGAVRDCIDAGPYSATSARDAGLVDSLLYADELEEEIAPLSPPRSGPRRPRLVESSDYHALCVGDAGWRPVFREEPRIAYVVANGPIQRGRGLRGVTSGAFSALFEELREDHGVRAVVLRVQSPGGDAVASDLLHREIERLAREKPVVVSMGDVAASGGYYLAAAADGVFAEAPTLTGSIGVVGGKANLEGLYRRVGIAKDGVERGARAGLLSEARGFTPGERVALTRQMEAVYDTFLDRVSRGRGLSREAVEKVAEGRVWSGVRAQALGLVDALGGPLEALRDARRRAGLADGERFRLELFPRRPSLPDVRSLIGSVLGRLSRG